MANDKKNYAVKVEGLAPVEVVFRVTAEDEEEALEMINRNMGQVTQKRITNTSRLTKKRATVYEYGSVMILKQKTY